MLKQIAKTARILFCLVSLLLLQGLVSLPASASIPLKITDLTYSTCPGEIGTGAVTSGGTSRPANCFIVTGTVSNPTGKTAYDADIYGRIYDANRNAILENRTRLGAIEVVPPGKHPFELRISVPANQPTPLILEQFKASGFSGSVKARF
jgi:hypothetical protein